MRGDPSWDYIHDWRGVRQIEGPQSLWVSKAKYEGLRAGERQMSKVLNRARVYILVQNVCVEQTYDTILVSMSHDDVGE